MNLGLNKGQDWQKQQKYNRMKHVNLLIKKVAIFILLSLAVACSTTPDEITLLDKSFKLYEHALRWQDYDVVIGFHKNERETLTEVRRKQLKRYRVTEYNVVFTKVENGNKSATQIVEIKYYNNEYAVVRNLTITHKWEYDEKNLRWQVTELLPDFR